MLRHLKICEYKSMMKVFLFALGLLAVNVEVFGQVVFVSERQQFHDPEALSSSQAKGSALLKPPFKVDALSQERWVDAIRNRRVALVIHGYNNEYEDSLEFFSNIVDRSSRLYETFICYFWPGYDDFWEYLAAKSMVTETDLPRRLLKLIEELSYHGKQLDVISFSMGCRLALEALNSASDTLVKNLFLLAPAVDNESIEKGERYAPAINKTQKTFVFYSENDSVLSWAYPIAEWDLALGSQGLENPRSILPNVYMVNSTSHIEGHGDYSKSSFIFNIISNVLRLDQ